jgi:succinate dehydrogenase / fumarate reductase, cytochrome b subunit
MNKFLASSLGKKTIMALTGLFLVLFLVEHLYTNLLLFAGDGGLAFDEASHSMVHNVFIRIVEVFLFLAIILHVYQAVMLTSENAKARPVKYAVDGTGKTASWFSRNMGLTGAMIFFFIVVHLYNFFVPYRITGSVGPDGHETLSHEVAEALENPWYALLYAVSVIILAFHINHGFQSAFQSLGMNNKKYSPLYKRTGTALAIIFGLGFLSFPVLFYFSHVTGFDILNWNQ